MQGFTTASCVKLVQLRQALGSLTADIESVAIAFERMREEKGSVPGGVPGLHKSALKRLFLNRANGRVKPAEEELKSCEPINE